MNLERARVASARRSEKAASASAARPMGFREDEPYSRVNVRQSPCTSTISGVRLRASVRPASTAAPTKGSAATTASGRNSRSWFLTRSGSRT